MSPRAIRRTAMLAATVATLTVSCTYAFGAAPRAHGSSASASSAAQAYSVSFAPNQPAKVSSLTMTVTSPQQPASVAIALPAGTVLNSGVLPTCAAPPACDPSTQVGSGKATVQYSKYLIPLNFSLFNRSGGLALVISNPNGTPIVVLPTWSGTTLDITYPNSFYKGVAIVVTKISLTFNRLGSGAHSYLRTPAGCPRSGWPSSTTFTASDASETVVRTAAHCQLASKHKKKKKR
jgi:hypothetical protein